MKSKHPMEMGETMRRTGWSKWISTIGVLALVLAACGGGDDGSSDDTDGGSDTTEGSGGEALSGTLVFFAYEDSFLPEALDPFVDAHPELTVETPAFADEDETETKLRAGFEADVVEMCAGEVGDMVTGGLLAPIETDRIDDWDLILPVFQDGLGTVDDEGNVFMVPLQGGVAGIAYNADLIPDGITSYEELFFGDWEGDISISADEVNSIGDMLMALGYGPDIFEATDEQVTEAVDKLIELKQSGRIRTTFESDTDLVNLLATEEVAASAHGFPALAGRLADEGVNVVYQAPDEGEVSWNCGHGISASAPNPDAAYALINHYMTPDVQIAFAEIEAYLASNGRTIEEGDPAIVEAMGLAAPAENFAGTIFEADPENREWWQDEWRRFLSS